MALRSGHGSGAGVPRIEVAPADELPQPVAVAPAEPVAPLMFRPDGRIADSATARTLGRQGRSAEGSEAPFCVGNGAR